MDNSIFEMLKLLTGMNGQNPMSQFFGQNNQNRPEQSQNFSQGYYPNEAFNNYNPQYNQMPDNNMLPLLLSLLNKGNSPLSDIFSQKKSNEEKNVSSQSSDPNDEVLL